MSTPVFSDGATIVIGGSGGLSRAICLSLAEAGTDVVFTHCGKADLAEEICKETGRTGQNIVCAPLDVTHEQSVGKFLNDMKERFQNFHTLVYAIGSELEMRYVADTSVTKFKAAIESELYGFLNVIKSALPILHESRGSIVALSTAALDRHSPKDILSTTSKAGISAIAQAVAREEGRFGIRANTVRVGVIDAGVTRSVFKQLSPPHVDALKKTCALKRVGTAVEVAQSVTFLASKRASFITGQHINVDGGYSA